MVEGLSCSLDPRPSFHTGLTVFDAGLALVLEAGLAFAVAVDLSLDLDTGLLASPVAA